MANKKRMFYGVAGPRFVGALLLGSALSTGLSPMLHVRTASAQSARTHNFDIPAQPLSSALRVLANQSGLQLAYKTAITSGAKAPAVRGTLSSSQALSRLLAGSGLTYSFTSSDTVTIATTSVAGTGDDDQGATALKPITIEGDSNNSLPETNGFVASGSLSATKSGTPLIETPQSVAVITRAQLDAQNAETIRQAIRYAPGVYTSDDADNRLDYFNARGFSLDQYLDGLKMISGTWSVPKFEPYLLDRVEVIQGPTSVLYGQAAPGGLVNLVSKRPEDDTFNEVQLQAGSGNRFQTAFDSNGLLNSDGTLLYRVTGVARTLDPQIGYTNERRIAVAPAVTWQPDGDTKLTILTGYLHDPNGGIWNQLPYEGTLLSNPNGQFSRSFYTGDRGFEKFERTQYNFGYELDHNFNDALSFHQSVRFLHQDLTYNAVQSAYLDPDLTTLNRSAYMADETLNTFSADNRLQAKFDTGEIEHTLVTGLDYQRKYWDNFTRWQWGAAPTLNILHPDYNQVITLPPVFQDAYQSQDQLGVYAQDQIKIGKLSFLFGIREDWANTKTDDHLADTRTVQNDHAFTWRAGAVYLADNGLAPYVSYSTSFQPTAGLDASSNPFKPTTGDQYEVGLKYQPVGSNSFFTLAAFDLTQQNLLTTDLSNPNFSTQTGEVRSRGIDASSVMSLTDGLSLRASYTVLDPKIQQSNDGVQGNVPAGVPRNLASLWVDYTFQSGTMEGFGLGGGIKYIGKTYADDANQVTIPSHTLFDAALHYDFGARNPKLKGLKLDVNAYNVFDRKFVDSCSLFGCAYGNGRTVYGTLTYRF